MVQVELNEYRTREIPLILQAVGSYAQQSDRAPIYVPLACHVPEAQSTGVNCPSIPIDPPGDGQESLLPEFLVELTDPFIGEGF